MESRCAPKCDLGESGTNPASKKWAKKLRPEVTLSYPLLDCKAPALCKVHELDTFLWDQGICYSAASCCWLWHLSHISNDGWIWSFHKEGPSVGGSTLALHHAPGHWEFLGALLVGGKEEKKPSDFHLTRFKIKRDTHTKKKRSARLVAPSALLGGVTHVLALTVRTKGICWLQDVWVFVSCPHNEDQKKGYFKSPCNR